MEMLQQEQEEDTLNDQKSLQSSIKVISKKDDNEKALNTKNQRVHYLLNCSYFNISFKVIMG
jgi:hypothetical protein